MLVWSIHMCLYLCGLCESVCSVYMCVRERGVCTYEEYVGCHVWSGVCAVSGRCTCVQAVCVSMRTVHVFPRGHVDQWKLEQSMFLRNILLSPLYRGDNRMFLFFLEELGNK